MKTKQFFRVFLLVAVFCCNYNCVVGTNYFEKLYNAIKYDQYKDIFKATEELTDQYGFEAAKAKKNGMEKKAIQCGKVIEVLYAYRDILLHIYPEVKNKMQLHMPMLKHLEKEYNAALKEKAHYKKNHTEITGNIVKYYQKIAERYNNQRATVDWLEKLMKQIKDDRKFVEEKYVLDKMCTEIRLRRNTIDYKDAFQLLYTKKYKIWEKKAVAKIAYFTKAVNNGTLDLIGHEMAAQKMGHISIAVPTNLKDNRSSELFKESRHHQQPIPSDHMQQEWRPVGEISSQHQTRSGATQFVMKDGTVWEKRSDGSIYFRNSAGIVTEMNRDGTPKQKNVKEWRPVGEISSQNKTRSGATQFVMKDGTVWEKRSDGTIIFRNSAGIVTEMNRDGTPKQKNVTPERRQKTQSLMTLHRPSPKQKTKTILEQTSEKNYGDNAQTELLYPPSTSAAAPAAENEYYNLPTFMASIQKSLQFEENALQNISSGDASSSKTSSHPARVPSLISGGNYDDDVNATSEHSHVNEKLFNSIFPGLQQQEEEEVDWKTTNQRADSIATDFEFWPSDKTTTNSATAPIEEASNMAQSIMVSSTGMIGGSNSKLAESLLPSAENRNVNSKLVGSLLTEDRDENSKLAKSISLTTGKSNLAGSLLQEANTDGISKKTQSLLSEDNSENSKFVRSIVENVAPGKSNLAPSLMSGITAANKATAKSIIPPESILPNADSSSNKTPSLYYSALQNTLDPSNNSDAPITIKSLIEQEKNIESNQQFGGNNSTGKKKTVSSLLSPTYPEEKN